MTARAANVRANVRAILEAAKFRRPGRRHWAPAYPDTTNGIKAGAGRDSFGVRQSGQSVLWWSEFRTTRQGLEEVRRGLFRLYPHGSHRERMKAEARNLITQSARHG